MGLDVNKFVNSKFDTTTEEIKLDCLKDFFGKDEKPVIKVKGLTGVELGFVNESIDRSKAVNDIVEKLMSTVGKEKAEGVFEGVGLSDETPSDIVRRIEIMKKGVVEPEVGHEFVLKFCDRFPVEFYEVTNKILELTGKGQSLVKPSPSGKKTA